MAQGGLLVALRRNWNANRIAALYALIGSLWILFSDELVTVNAASPDVVMTLSALKGLGYVAVTALGLRWLINRHTSALRESEERYRILSETISDYAYSFRFEPDGRTIYEWVTPSFIRFHGYTLDELTARGGTLTLVHPDDMDIARDHIRALLAGRPDTREFRVVRKDGQVRWVRNYARPIWDEAAQRTVRLYGSTQDITERKHAEEALRQSEEKFSKAFMTSPYAITITRLTDGRFLEVNDAFTVISGYTRDEALAGSSLSLNLWVDPAERQRAVSTLLSGQPLSNWDIQFRRKDGQTITCRLASQLLEIEGDTCILTSLDDITERQRVERALRDSEERYRLLAETSPDAISLHQDGRFVFVNPAACALMGAACPEELVGRSIQDVVHPDYRAIVNERVRAALQDNQAVPVIEEVFVRLDGRPVEVEVAAASLRIDGRPAMQVVARDITARKQREREITAIAAVATALRSASDSGEMATVIVQQVHDLLKADGAALMLHDASTGETVVLKALGFDAASIGMRLPPGAGLTGRVIASRQPYVTQDIARDPFIYRPELLAGFQAIACVPLIAQDRAIGALWAARAAAIGDEEVRVLAAIGDIAANALYRAEVLETLEQRVADRTRELAEANERLKELDRLKSKFVSDVSHELRTPVTSLLLNVELLEHGKPEKREHYLQVIKQQTARQVQLIEDILNLSRLDLSTTTVKFAPVDVNAVVSQAVSLYRSSAEAVNLRLSFTPDPRLPPVLGVESHLSQVVTNLIANAINYTPAGSVEVLTRQLDREVMIEVRDTGLGIAPEDMPHLFERFYRGKLTWQVRGSGLGLAIVKEIAELHHGRVEVDSQAGVGSVFRVYLPAA